ncbi:MAG TPA: hypothetical protein VG944_20750 [Fimbriimonas sp.]|nr:hypothetical protein [Fimbriimonas sp.]
MKTPTLVRLCMLLLTLTLAAVSNAQSLASFKVTPTLVFGGQSSNATIKLAKPAAGSGLVVQVSCAHSYVHVPATVLVPAGQSSVTFAVGTDVSLSNKSSTITCSAGSVALKASLLMLNPSVNQIQLFPNPIVGSKAGNVNIELSEATPADAVVHLTSNQKFLQVPSTLATHGSNFCSFELFTKAVAKTSVGTITATYGDSSCQLQVTVESPSADSVLCQWPVIGGFGTNGFVDLTGYAPAGDVVVQLRSNQPFLQVPATVTVPQNSIQGTFKATTSPVDTPQIATISAFVEGVGQTVTFDVHIVPVGIQSITLSPSTISGGEASKATVTLSMRAPANGPGVTVFLASDQSCVQVPPSAFVKPGNLTATFEVHSTQVSQKVLAHVSATTATTVSAPLTVEPLSLLVVLRQAMSSLF